VAGPIPRACTVRGQFCKIPTKVLFASKEADPDILNEAKAEYVKLQ